MKALTLRIFLISGLGIVVISKVWSTDPFAWDWQGLSSTARGVDHQLQGGGHDDT